MTEMTTRKILIVDDEPLARRRIKDLLANETFAIEEAEDGVVAIEKIKEEKPDIVFLDIQMPEVSGFDVINAFDTIDFPIIFQTAFDDFAVQAFEVSACDYLLKPFSDERFQVALNKALGQIKQGKNSNYQPLFDHLKENKRFLNNITVKVGAQTKIVEIQLIDFFFSEDHTTSIYLKSGQNYVVDHSLNFLEEKLDPSRYVRIHRNAIVDINEIVSFSKGTQMNVTLKNGRTLKVARDRRKGLRQLISDHLGI